LRGRVDRHAVPYQIVGCAKRHASIPIGQTERIYAPTLESILQTAWILRSPIGSHIPNSSTLQVEVLRVEGKNLPCCTRKSHSHPCHSRIACVCIVIRKRVQRRHVMIRSNRYVVWTARQKCSRWVGVSLAPALLPAEGASSSQPFSRTGQRQDRCKVQPLSVMHGTP
jgi:hypothetical protein